MATFFYTVLITPLELFIEFIYTASFRILGHEGFSIIMVSLVVNLLLLPLYCRAEALSSAESARYKELSFWRDHIRAAFQSDERHMRLSSYYREAGYHPAMAFLSVAPLLMQIPFFIAAYHFFSNLGVLSGASFSSISDLAKPDGLIRLSDQTSIHILPILMTLMNCLSVYIYSKDASRREKIRSYGLAVLFLLLLYTSPSGLVLYWTTNNCFSLVKNIVLKAHPLPEHTKDGNRKNGTSDHVMTVLLLLELTLFLGGIIPSAVVGSSVTEMVNIGVNTHPLHYVFYALQVFGGLFLVWGAVLWYLLSPEKKKIFQYFLIVLLFFLLGEYCFFPYRGGSLSNALTFISQPQKDSVLYIFRNLSVCFCCSILAALLWKRIPRLIYAVMIALPVISIAFFAREALQIHRTGSAWYAKRRAEESKYNHPVVPLSRNGHNVIIIGLDRAINAYIPFLFTEKPELFEAFDGFTWYPNTASFGCSTPMAMPPLMGGYEYTPMQMNARIDELLVDKTNEALRVMPTLFGEADYKVTIVDPPLANYMTPGDLSIYDDLPYVNAFRMEGYYSTPEEKESASALLERNMIFYSFYRSAPSVFKNFFYDDGCYWNASGYFPPSSFVEAYAVLDSLPSVTAVDSSDEDTFFLLYNNTAHEPALLSSPDYTLGDTMTGYTDTLPHFFKMGDQTLSFTDIVNRSYMVSHYHINMAAMLRLADYFNYLKEEGVWDNTRIIITADHGWNLGNFEDYRFSFDFQIDDLDNVSEETRQELEESVIDIEAFNPLFLVKDFNSEGFTVDHQFMTNADVPVLATADLIRDPVNPYTLTPITTDTKYYGIDIADSSIIANPYTSAYPTQFPLEGTLILNVHDNIFQPENWTVRLYKDPSGR